MKKFSLLICFSIVFICSNTGMPQYGQLLAAEAEANPSPPAYETDLGISYRDEADTPDDYAKDQCRLDFYYPTNRPGFATVVWFHGGGLSGGSRFIPEELKGQGIAIAAAGYRLHPKVTCPTYIDDAAAAVAWAFKNVERFGGDPKRIYVSGHSAGGYLTAMVGMDKRWLAKYGVDADRIAGLIPFSGHTITHFTIRKERGIPDSRPFIDEFAPLYHVRPDAPPLVLLTGDRELEMLGRYEENAYMMRMMKNAGHKNTVLYEFQGFDHGSMAIPGYAILLKHVTQK